VAVPGPLLDEIIRYSMDCLPVEACGFLAGREGFADRFVPAPNALASADAFSVDPAFLFRFFRGLRWGGEQLVGIVHSHPRGPASPSQRDIREAHYREAAHLIVSLAGERPEIRAYRITAREAIEIELHAIV
jgi:proteasome lid subunit RPN8/RPN11